MQEKTKKTSDPPSAPATTARRVPDPADKRKPPESKQVSLHMAPAAGRTLQNTAFSSGLTTVPVPFIRLPHRRPRDPIVS